MAGVRHPFSSGIADGGDTSLVRPINWNADHLGNSLPGLMVAATGSPAKDKGAADYTCDGTADDVELQAALDAVVSAGGGNLFLAGGDYTLATGLTITGNVRINIFMHGARLLLPASTDGITINQGISTTRGVFIYGGIIDGQSNAGTTGVVFQDTNWSALLGVVIENAATGILMHSATANNFVEGITLEDIVIRNPTTYGIEYRRTSGTNSFGQHNYRNVNINVGGSGTGFYVASGCSIYRSRIQVGVWIGTGQTGINFDGDFDNVVMDLYVEGATGSTGNTGLTIGTNAQNLDRAIMHLTFWGTVNTTVSNAFNKDYWYRTGRSLVGGNQATTAPLRFRKHSDTGDQFVVGLNGVAGGRVYWGNGTGTLDAYIERAGALVLGSNAKIDPASLNLQTKAGTPVDGDVVGGAANGDVIWDSTGKFLWVRDAGSWRKAEATHEAAVDPHPGYRREDEDHSHAGTGLQAGQVTHANLASVTANQHHNQAHAIASADHTASGLLAGSFMRATGTTTFGFQSIPISRGGTLFNSAGITAAVNLIVWRAPFACTVTNVRGYRVGGTGATINARRNGTSNHLASALSLTSADTWQDGGSVQNTAYAAGDKLEIMVVSATGSPTQIAIQVDFTRP